MRNLNPVLLNQNSQLRQFCLNKKTRKKLKLNPALQNRNPEFHPNIIIRIKLKLHAIFPHLHIHLHLFQKRIQTHFLQSLHLQHLPYQKREGITHRVQNTNLLEEVQHLLNQLEHLLQNTLKNWIKILVK